MSYRAVHNVSDIQWINTILNVGIIPLLYLIHKLERAIDKLRLDVTEQYVKKADFDDYKREHRKDWHDE